MGENRYNTIYWAGSSEAFCVVSTLTPLETHEPVDSRVRKLSRLLIQGSKGALEIAREQTVPYFISHFNQLAHQPSQTDEWKSSGQFRMSLTRLSRLWCQGSLKHRCAELWWYSSFQYSGKLLWSAAITSDLSTLALHEETQIQNPSGCNPAPWDHVHMKDR